MSAEAAPAARGPAGRLDGTLHHPTRLAVVAFLAACEEAEFAAVRDDCRVSDSVLSKAASLLEASGHLSIRKGHVGRRPRTWLSLTPAGRRALADHLAALQEIAADAGRLGAEARNTAREEGGAGP